MKTHPRRSYKPEFGLRNVKNYH